MIYRQTCWALRTKDGKWRWNRGKELAAGALCPSRPVICSLKESGDRIVRVKVTMEVSDD
jgi:hypothetical protein